MKNLLNMLLKLGYCSFSNKEMMHQIVCVLHSDMAEQIAAFPNVTKFWMRWPLPELIPLYEVFKCRSKQLSICVFNFSGGD